MHLAQTLRMGLVNGGDVDGIVVWCACWWWRGGGLAVCLVFVCLGMALGGVGWRWGCMAAGVAAG